MFSRKNSWLIFAIPMAVILLWIAQNGQSGPPASPTALPDLSGQLVYLAPASGSAELIALDLESLVSERLSQEAAIKAFHVSSDGAFIVFSSSNKANGSSLWQLDLGDRSTKLLLDCGESLCDAPQISPNNQNLAYTMQAAESGNSQIWLLDLDSGLQTRVSPEGQTSFYPLWSQVGRLSYYNQDAGAYETILPGSELRKHSANSFGGLYSWAADGSSFVAPEAITVSSDILRGTSGEASLQTPDPDTQSTIELRISLLVRYGQNDKERVLNYGEELIEDAAPQFSPDGEWLAFTRKYLDEAAWTPGRQLWLLNLANEELIQLSNAPNYQISGVAWSADSEMIAYVRANRTAFNQPLEIRVIGWDGSSAQLLAVDAFAPQWLP